MNEVLNGIWKDTRESWSFTYGIEGKTEYDFIMHKRSDNWINHAGIYIIFRSCGHGGKVISNLLKDENIVHKGFGRLRNREREGQTPKGDRIARMGDAAAGTWEDQAARADSGCIENGQSGGRAWYN